MKIMYKYIEKLKRDAGTKIFKNQNSINYTFRTELIRIEIIRRPSVDNRPQSVVRGPEGLAELLANAR